MTLLASYIWKAASNAFFSSDRDWEYSVLPPSDQGNSILIKKQFMVSEGIL